MNETLNETINQTAGNGSVAGLEAEALMLIVVVIGFCLAFFAILLKKINKGEEIDAGEIAKEAADVAEEVGDAIEEVADKTDKAAKKMEKITKDVKIPKPPKD